MGFIAVLTDLSFKRVGMIFKMLMLCKIVNSCANGYDAYAHNFISAVRSNSVFILGRLRDLALLFNNVTVNMTAMILNSPLS